jgi:hypothetical protein
MDSRGFDASTLARLPKKHQFPRINGILMLLRMPSHPISINFHESKGF